MNEALPGEVTLVYNTSDGAYAVALSKEQHVLLQAFVSSIGSITVVKQLQVEYKPL